MDFFSLVCDICGTVNRIERTHCLACGQVLRASSSSASLTAAPTVPVLSRKLLKQRYRVMHVVGQGGMGTVYIGVDTHLGNRLVAIKEMSQSGLNLAERQTAARNFQREAHLLAGLQHPNLPSIYDHFSENQRWYLVMSFIKGQTLAAYLKSRGGRLEMAEVVELGLVLCSVLHYLHMYRPPIIFRDLKPSNIMRTVDGHIYLIDFGIARVFKPRQTTDTAYQGSVGYAPPEQYGTSQTTPRSDIYALGVTLYRLLTGYEPASTPFNLPPLQSLLPETPTPLVALITSMLALDETQRPQSADQVRWELQKIADGATSATPARASTSAPIRLRARRALDIKKWAIISFIVLAVLSLGFASFVVYDKINAANNVSASNRVISTFCDAFNSTSPDFQRAYQQLSANYRRTHSLNVFRAALQGARGCEVVSLPDVNAQAEVKITMRCMVPPGAPPPPSFAPPPVSPSPVYLTMVQDGDNGWRIGTMSVISQICPPPPGGRPRD